MAVKRAEDRSDTDKSISRRDDISLQGTVTITAAAKEVEEEEDMIIRVMLSQLIDTVIFIFNLAFLVIMEATATSQRHLLTRKCQNKFLIVLQE
ncbi:hypothetical protein BDBG_17090 [Blastomyces gilchristii SLH14081]|uniref:Uncharacterized protein n=1 Tax=Blastomyces gilchristii (strain SLH14081) TaxID=559298 RepID=A0A179ULA2_BLAGS|nr:uncharacterized protein BDBG_17090 [Blastomyces gilchristii SLH14081]OAT08660.1 hypothetical protein BDBG_17090 [Blastomyces gilchristii SLH14081]